MYGTIDPRPPTTNDAPLSSISEKMSSVAVAAAVASSSGDAIEPSKSSQYVYFCDESVLFHHSHSSNLTPPTAITSSSESSSDEEANDDGQDDTIRVYFDGARIERMNKRAKEENERLNLNLGLPVDLTVFTRSDDDITANGLVQKVLRPPIRTLLRLLDRLLSLVESPLFNFWSNRIPLRFRQKLTFLAWGMYLPIHKALIGRRTGLHRNVSLEYHALTSVMWWGRLVSFTSMYVPTRNHIISDFLSLSFFFLDFVSHSFLSLSSE